MSKLVLPDGFGFQPQYPVEFAPAYRDAILCSLFNEVTGRDVSANRNNLVPGVAPTQVVRGHGKAFNFNGSTQYLVSSKTIPQGTSFTVFAWVRPAALNTGYIRVLETDFSTGFYLGSNTGSKYAWIVNNSAFEGCIGGQQVAGQRDFVCGVFDKDALTRILYVNGLQVASASCTAPFASQTLSVGRYSGNASYWNGDIDTVGIFPRVLSPADILGLYQNPWKLFQAPQRRLWVTVPAAGGTVALTGQAASLSAGTLSPATSVGLSGQALASSQGSVKPSLSIALTGQSLTGGQGTLGANTSVALSGQAVTASAGALSPSTSIGLSGIALTSPQGSFGPSTSIALSGQSLASAQGTLSVSGVASAALSGQSLTSAQGTLTPLAASNIALTGQSITSAQGSLGPATDKALSGQYLTSNQGSVGVSVSVPLTGQRASFSTGSLAVAGDVTVALTGIGLTLSQGILAVASAQQGGHYGGANLTRKRKIDRDFKRDELRDDLEKLVRGEVEELKEDITQPEVPKEVKAQARKIIKEYQQPSIDLDAIYQDILRVKGLIEQYEKDAQDEDEELLFMFM